jgi:hypothetical protein
MTEEEKLDSILNDCIRRFNYDGVYLRTEMEAFWQDTCIKTTGQPDTNNEKFKAYLKHLKEDGYIEFNDVQKFYKATIKGKKFIGYVNQKELDKKDDRIRDLTISQLKFRWLSFLLGAFVTYGAVVIDHKLTESEKSNTDTTQVRILNYPTISDTTKVLIIDSLINIRFQKDSVIKSK